jgi:hypothetical protein
VVFSDTWVSITNQTDRNDITEVLLKLALYTTTLTPICIHIFVSIYDCLFIFILLRPGLALSQLDQLLPLKPTLELSTLSCSSTHSNTLQVLQRTALSPAPPKAGYGIHIFASTWDWRFAFIFLFLFKTVDLYSSFCFHYDCLLVFIFMFPVTTVCLYSSCCFSLRLSICMTFVFIFFKYSKTRYSVIWLLSLKVSGKRFDSSMTDCALIAM